MIKRLFAIVLCVMLVFGVMCGCAGKSDKKDPEKIEAQIKEDIVGYWKKGSYYMAFFDNGEVAIVNPNADKAEILPYAVDGDTVILSGKNFTENMYSVAVDDDTLKYNGESGSENVWVSIPIEEMQAVIELLK